jgi:hypothetical protein
VSKAPARFDIGGEGRDVAGFLARLVGGIFLRARIFQDVAERGGERERALLAMQDRRQLPARGLVGEFDLLLAAHRVADAGAEDREEFLRQRHLGFEIEGRAEIDIFLVQRIPEMVMRRADDLVEGGRAIAVALDIEHRRKIGRIDGVVGVVLGDLDHCDLPHARLRNDE